MTCHGYKLVPAIQHVSCELGNIFIILKNRGILGLESCLNYAGGTLALSRAEFTVAQHNTILIANKAMSEITASRANRPDSRGTT